MDQPGMYSWADKNSTKLPLSSLLPAVTAAVSVLFLLVANATAVAAIAGVAAVVAGTAGVVALQAYLSLALP